MKNAQAVAEISLELDYLRAKLGRINPDGALGYLETAIEHLKAAGVILDKEVLPRFRRLNH